MTVETGSVDIAGRNPSTASLLIDGNHQPPDDDAHDSGPGWSGARMAPYWVRRGVRASRGLPKLPRYCG